MSCKIFIFLHIKSLRLVRGHSTTTWTEFCHFLTPPPCVDSFYTLSVDKNRHFLTPSPLFLSTYLLNPKRYYLWLLKPNKKSFFINISMFASQKWAIILVLKAQNSLNLLWWLIVLIIKIIWTFKSKILIINPRLYNQCWSENGQWSPWKSELYICTGTVCNVQASEFRLKRKQVLIRILRFSNFV